MSLEGSGISFLKKKITCHVVFATVMHYLMMYYCGFRVLIVYLSNNFVLQRLVAFLQRYITALHLGVMILVSQN